MASGAFVCAKEVFHHRNGHILKLWDWINNEKQFVLFKFNNINKHLHLEKKINQLKLRDTDPCNCLAKYALVSQPSTLVVAMLTLFEFIT